MVTANNNTAATNNNERDHYSAKPSIFDVNGYVHPINAEGNNITRSAMTNQQKKDFKNYHKARTILLNVISYTEYERITNRYFAKSIFDSLRMTHEGNAQVKETKVLALIHKYEAFKMEDDETVETTFSRFQMFVAGLKILDKGYSMVDRVKKIIRSLPKKWRPMVTALKLANDLSNIILEELIRAYQAKEESEDSNEDSKGDDELSLISKRVNRLWKHMKNGQGKFRGAKRIVGHSDSSSGPKKQGFGKEVIRYECKEPGHYKNEYPELKKDKRPKKNLSKGKKGLVATWHDSESKEEVSDEEYANVALMATITDPEGYEEQEDKILSESESNSDSEEVFFELSRSDLKSCLSKILEKYQSLKSRYRDLKQVQLVTSETRGELEKDISSLNEKIYDRAFQYFLAKIIDISKMISMIYGVNKNGKKG
ncbi:uncharacterized protein LOC127095830 [Lathyrus oleraceus]|uniref:uncharacterized protein LOC127095830 n=1 Tax=Pisum sativum TaxID=3888 RepID=UPI0021CDEC3D|nr:uncharacterized protein LOC127095830 [Pisum sativum]